MKRPKSQGSTIGKTTARDETRIEAVLKDAVSYLADDFDNDDPIDGGDLVEWFSEWRQQAKRALERRD